MSVSFYESPTKCIKKIRNQLKEGNSFNEMTFFKTKYWSLLRRDTTRNLQRRKRDKMEKKKKKRCQEQEVPSNISRKIKIIHRWEDTCSWFYEKLQIKETKIHFNHIRYAPDLSYCLKLLNRKPSSKYWLWHSVITGMYFTGIFTNEYTTWQAQGKVLWLL